MNQDSESLPPSLMAVISLLEETLACFPNPLHQHNPDHLSACCTGMSSEDEMWLIYRWDTSGCPSSPRMQVSPAFCCNIAGLLPEKFNARFAAGDLSLPCSPLQFLSYCVDGALCIEEGHTSWTRCCPSHRPCQAASGKSPICSDGPCPCQMSRQEA